MHKLRNAVIAGAAAVALTLGGTSVAGAAEAPAPEDASMSSILSSVPTGGSSALGDATDADDRGTGEDALGEETDEEATPEWLATWRDLTKVAGIGTVVGAIIAAVNFFQFLNA